MRLLVGCYPWDVAPLLHHLRHHAVLSTGGGTTALLTRWSLLSLLALLTTRLLAHRHLLLHLRLHLFLLYLSLVLGEVAHIPFFVGTAQGVVFG